MIPACSVLAILVWLEWLCQGQMFQTRPTPISHGDAGQIQSRVTFLSPAALSSELVLPMLVSASDSERPPEQSGQLGWAQAEFRLAEDMTVSWAGHRRRGGFSSLSNALGPDNSVMLPLGFFSNGK